MRRLASIADVERTRRRNNIILGVTMIVLMLGSSLGYSLMSADGGSDNSVSEMGFDFVRDGGMWKMIVDGEIFGFRYLPSEVSDVEVNLSVDLGMYSGQPLYFVNPGEGLNDILANLDRYILRYQEACFRQDSVESVVDGGWSDDLVNLTDSNENVSLEVNESEVVCEGDLPMKDCSSNLIVFIEGNETRVYGEDRCVFIVGDASLGSNAFLYEVLDIR